MVLDVGPQAGANLGNYNALVTQDVVLVNPWSINGALGIGRA